MRHLEALHRPELSLIDTLVFAGGGNRCWWQAGVVDHLRQGGWTLPPQLVGTSAGAAVAASCLTEGGAAAALAACLRLYAANERVFDWSGLARLKLRFAHEHIYPAWIESFVHSGNFAQLLASGSRLRVAITRPARALGLSGSIAAATLAYVVDKHLWHSIHPRLPKLMGLRQDFADLHHCASAAEAQTLLSAAAAAPPFMPARQVGGARAIDEGYTDNAPIHPQSPEEKARTLVLLTRHYPRLPAVFRWRGRAYWQPRQRVCVSTWDCTVRATVGEAFCQGQQDADRLFPARLPAVSAPRPPPVADRRWT